MALSPQAVHRFAATGLSNSTHVPGLARDVSSYIGIKRIGGARNLPAAASPVGYNPAQGDDGDYPADIQAAEAKVAAKHQAESSAVMGLGQAGQTKPTP